MNKNSQNLKEAIKYPESGILSQEIFKNEKVDVTLFCLAKGTEISEHTSAKAGMVYVLEGKGLFNLAGKDIIMSPATFIFMAENTIHSLRADQNLTFILILCKY